MFVCDLGATTILSLTFSSDGSMLAGTNDGRVLHVVPHAEPVLLLQALGEINAVCGSATGRIALATPTNWQVLEPGHHQEDVERRVRPATAIEFFDEDTVAVGFGDRARPQPGGFELWRLTPPKRREPHFAEPKGVRAIAVLGSIVAWSTGHQKLTVWDTARQDPIHIPLKSTSPAIAFLPSGERIVAALDYNVMLVDIAKRHEAMTFTGHKGRVTSVAIHPDGRMMATGSWDQTVRLWDLVSGQAVGLLTSPAGRISTVTYSPDGTRLAAGGDAGKIVIWDVE